MLVECVTGTSLALSIIGLTTAKAFMIEYEIDSIGNSGTYD